MSILDLLKEVPLSAVLKEKIATLETENKSLKSEIAIIKEKLSQSEQQRRTLEEQVIQKQTQFHNSNPLGYVCDHCGCQKLKRTGNRPDPTFGVLGAKQSIFICEACGKESAYSQA